MDKIASLRQQKIANSLNTDFLREQACEQIETLASDRWTDYNTHDPGITILDQLAYAITELSLRSSQPIEDLLAGADEHSFYTAREVLPNAALTPNDYRRLLLGRPEVLDALVNIETRGDVAGLYDLKVLFDGQLNDSWIEQDIELRDDEENIRVYFVPPRWDRLPVSWRGDDDISSIRLRQLNEGEFVSRIEDTDGTIRYYAEASVTIGSVEMVLGTWIYTQVPVPSELDAPFRTRLLAHLRSLENSGRVAGVYPRFRARTRKIVERLVNLRLFLNQHRNLCEDWSRIEPVRIQQIAVNVTRLDLEGHADPVAVLANILFRLQQWIEPRLRPRSLEKLLAEGKSPEDIFQGEQLDPGSGFVLEQDLQGLERGDNIYTSDLVRFIMEVPGVFALSGLSLRAFIDRLEVNRDVRNCLHLIDPKEFYPRLSTDDCEIQVFRQGVPVHLDIEVVKPDLQQLRDEFQAGFPSTSAADLPVPLGQALDIETYYSIQNEFPQTYRLRQGEIVPDMPALRKAQAKQLKGYLLLFEQLLANYCSQLAHVPDLFSIRKRAERSYFFQPLYSVPAVQNLIQAFRDEQDDGPLSWEQFILNCNSYIKALNFAAEDQQAFRERRQQFIEHLMNRFGESFGDYATWVRVTNGGQVSSDLIVDQLNFLQDYPELSARRATAFDYSAQTENGEGTVVPDVWDTENVSGVEKRVARLLGIPDYRRRNLSSVFDITDYRQIYEEIDSEEDGIHEERFRFWNAPVEEVFEEGRITSVDDVDHSRYKILLSSTRHYLRREDLEKEAEKVAEVGKRGGSYVVVAQTDPPRSEQCKYYINLLDERLDTDDPIARRIDYPTNRGQVEQDIAEVIHLMQGRYAEGMHLIEHVLLRPLDGSTEELAPVEFLLTGSQGRTYRRIFVKDPYSFQVSIFLPGWAPRFQDPEFRVIVERTLRQGIPAHILPWIYRIDPFDNAVPGLFSEFEETYQNWLSGIRADDRAARRDAFVRIFNELVAQSYVTLTNQTAYQPFSLDR